MAVQSLIETLASDLKPVRLVRPRSGITVTLIAAFVSALGVIALSGARGDILAGTPDPIVIVRGLLLVLLGLATSLAAANAARPAVGQGHNGWLWALAAALVLPIAGALLYGYHLIAAKPFADGDMDFRYALHCFGISAASAAVIGTAQTLWLRRGAPTDLNRAAWLIGLASGSFGTFAYSLHCPSNSIYYVGWCYGLAVALCAIISRIIAPPLLKW